MSTRRVVLLALLLSCADFGGAEEEFCRKRSEICEQRLEDGGGAGDLEEGDDLAQGGVEVSVVIIGNGAVESMPAGLSCGSPGCSAPAFFGG